MHTLLKLWCIVVFVIGAPWIAHVSQNHMNMPKIAGTWISSAKNITFDHSNNVLCANLRTGNVVTVMDEKCTENNNYTGTLILLQNYNNDCIKLENHDVSLANKFGKFIIEKTSERKYYSELRPIEGINVDMKFVEFFPNNVLCYKHTHDKKKYYDNCNTICQIEICYRYADYNYFTSNEQNGFFGIIGISDEKYKNLIS